MVEQNDLKARQFFKLPELARLLGITHQALHLWLLKGKIRTFDRTSESGNYLVPREEAIRLLKDHGREVEGLWTRTRRRVLVIDDYAPIRMLVREAFSKPEFPLAIKTAASAEDGLVLAATFNPHVIVMDLGLGDEGLQGDQAIAVIRRASALKGARIIGMAGHASARARMLDAGANSFLRKPFGLSELREAIYRQAFGRVRRKLIGEPMEGIVSDIEKRN